MWWPPGSWRAVDALTSRLLAPFLCADEPRTASNLPQPTQTSTLTPVLPRAWYPAWATAAFDWYGATYGDPLILGQPAWFKALVWVEVLLQLPFFFVGAAWFAAGDPRVVRPAAAYGVSTATTLVPILAELLTSPAAAPARATLLAFYAPYLVVPQVIGVAMLAAAGADPFVEGGRGRRKAA